ncbi:MAG: hypothetical protein KTR16_14575 [Acidiferrobacterales bacterium]|nr:hypothetical protein [Acidiferrobacterales bacterium]
MKVIATFLLLVSVVVAPQAQARNDYKEFSIAEAMALPQFKSKLGSEVRFYFGDSKPSGILNTIGEWPSQKKTNAFNKSDEFACQWALLSTLLALKKRALDEGGNAVINIQTNNDHRLISSSQTFECEVGNVIASVAVKGTVVKLDR